jgi:hypothetical protein
MTLKDLWGKEVEKKHAAFLLNEKQFLLQDDSTGKYAHY